MRLTYLGHASVLIELDGIEILTDPLLRPRVAHLRRLASPVAPELLEKVDHVLISHAHHDHLDVRSLKLLDDNAEVICPAPARGAVGRAGLQSRIVRAGDVIEKPPLRIEVVAADHDGRRWPTASSDDAVGFIVRGTTSVYFAGDTGFFDGLGSIRDVDVALLPVAGWGPKVGPGHLNPAEAARAAEVIAPRFAVPIHWGTYRRLLLRQPEAPDAPAHRFAAEVGQLAPDVVVKVLQPGEALSVA